RGDRRVQVGGALAALRREGRWLRVPTIPRWWRRLALEVPDDRPTECDRVLVVERLVVGDARPSSVDLGAAEILGRDLFARGRLHQRRSAEEDRAGAFDDDSLVA